MGCSRLDRNRAGWLVALAICAAAGCQTVRTPEEKIAKSNLPNEFHKVSMPEYVVEPPDIIDIEVFQALPGRPITGERLVRPDGTVTLGFYGDIYVEGLTVNEIKEKVVLHLRKYLTDSALGIDILDPADPEKVVAHLDPKDSDRVSVDVMAYNSKVYYVSGDVAQPGRMPVTGNETVLDAINYAGGMLPTAAQGNIRLVRPAPPGACCEQILPVNYAAIVSGGDSTTNYQLMPGDRIVVYRDPIVRFGILVDRIAAPIQQTLGVAFQYGYTKRILQGGSGLFGGAGGAGTSAAAARNAAAPNLNNNPLPGAR